MKQETKQGSTARRVSRRGLLLLLAGALATGAASVAAAAKPKLECPANWERGSRACKRARADRKCPELRGGKCLADEPTSSPTTADTTSTLEAGKPPSS